jgi:hypothetical protein
MARAADAATRKIMRLLTATPGVNTNLEVLAELEQVTLPAITDKQIATQNMAADVAERSADVKYPVVHVYCEKIANTLREKFRTFSGEAHMAIEVRLSQDRLDGLDRKLQLYVDAVTQVLDKSRGDWGRGLFYGGGYEAVFGPVKHGGRNFIQIAKITFEVGASSN